MKKKTTLIILQTILFSLGFLCTSSVYSADPSFIKKKMAPISKRDLKKEIAPKPDFKIETINFSLPQIRDIGSIDRHACPGHFQGGISKKAALTDKDIVFNVLIKNIGKESAPESSMVRLEIEGGTPNTLIQYELGIPGIAKGKMERRSFTHKFQHPGHYKVTAYADIFNNINEANEHHNNMYQVEIDVVDHRPDLWVAICHVGGGDRLQEGERIPVEACVVNIGHMRTQPTKLNFIRPNRKTAIHNIPGLDPYQCYRVADRTRYRHRGWKRVTVVADSNNAVEERNEKNNMSSVQYYICPLLDIDCYKEIKWN